MLTLIVGAPLALRTPQPVSTRRDALIAASGLAASASVLPAYAGLPFDPIGAYGKIGPGPMGPPPRVKGQPNSGILLLREVFDGALPEEGLLAWYEQHLAADFTATFAGKVVLDRQASPPPPLGGALSPSANSNVHPHPHPHIRTRTRTCTHAYLCTSHAQAYLTATADLLKSFPDFVYTRQGAIAYQDSPTLVGWTAVVRGTHSGAPYSPLPGVPPVSAKSPPVACQNDPEKVLVTFASGSKLQKIAKLQVDALPGGKGFSGPVGFYLQAGGDPSKLPPSP